jgi:hypothetical protein
MDNPQFQEIVKDLKKKNKAVKDRHQNLSDQGVVIKSLDAVQNAVIRSIEVLVTSLLEDTLKTRVVNQIEMPKNIGTPDALAGAQRVEQAVTQLKQAIVGKDIDLSGVVGHLEAISGTLAKLPTQYPSFPKMPSEMAVNNLSEVCDKLDLLGIELQNLKLDPKIDVKAPEIKIDLSKELKQIETAIKSISQEVKIPEYKQDNTDIVKAMKDVKKTIESIQFPIPNFRTEDIVNQAKIIPGLNIPEHDEIELTYVTSGNGIGEIGTVVYKLNSTTVATLTLSYDANDKLSGVVKS